MAEISEQTHKLIQKYQNWYQSLQAKEGAATLHVDEVASRVAAIYEKFRGLFDWKEEHLLRRAAIWRILKRKLLLMLGQKIEAQPLVLELIRTGHFPNDKIEESKVAEIQKSLDKYIFIAGNSPAPKKEKSKPQLQHWLLGIAACEIEEILDPQRKERALLEYMDSLMRDSIKTVDPLAEEERNTQIYIAVQRALFKLDAPIISYHLLRRKYQQWLDLPQDQLEEITKNIYAIWDNIENELRHPLSEKFYRICERYDTPYLILGDILSQDPMNIQEKLDKPEVLENLIRKSYQIRLSQLKSRLAKAAILSTISIFLTKILIAIAVEYPFDKYITHQFSYEILAMNILIPPFLMLFLVLSTRPPRKGNLEKVVLETMKIVYTRGKKDAYVVKSARRRGGLIMKGIIFIFYIATFFASFWVIWWILNKLNFSWPSKIIFVIFFSLISFAGTRIKERAQELSVEESKSNVIGFIFDWFSIPFLRLGKWLASQWEKNNLIVLIIFMFTAIIDLPFQVFIEFLEQWRFFIKEKKEEIH